MRVACITGPEDLAAAAAMPAQYPGSRSGRPPRGRSVPCGDSAIRETLRVHVFRDTKSCAVAARLTATRYHPA